MNYFLSLFSPQTYEAFKRSSREISGFRIRQLQAAHRVSPGDALLCYLTTLGRWFEVLEVVEGPFTDQSPVFYPENDPFVVRFKVIPRIVLDVEHAIPIREEGIWSQLTFTRGHAKNSSTFTGKLRRSLGSLDESDGKLLQVMLEEQSAHPKTYPVDMRAYRKLILTAKGHTGVVSVSVPENEEPESEETALPREQMVRESLKIQALIADIGARMGMSVWIPRSDRAAVIRERAFDTSALLDRLPLNYDETTLSTIENIDVLWLRGRAMARAFEVEHTTSVYSGLLRMADLLALQPNIDIRLHIVAPESKREKVFAEIRRPVFSLLDRGPLSASCTFISYDALRELSDLKHLDHMDTSVLDEYAEEAD